MNHKFLFTFAGLLFLSSFALAQTSQTFTSSDTFIVPNNVFAINVHAWGAGGGGSDNIFGPPPLGGHGGGGGGFAGGTLNVAPGDTLIIWVGNGGMGASGGLGTNGGHGDSTYVIYMNDTLTAFGGNGGVAQANGIGTGGTGGSFSGSLFVNQTTYAGGNGGLGDNQEGGGGGGGAGSMENGGVGSDAFANEPTPGGSGGNENGGDGGFGGNDGSGTPGETFGGGGGGSGKNNAGDGGDGGDGGVIISWDEFFACAIRSDTFTLITTIFDTFSVPLGVLSIDVQAWGGGGGGSLNNPLPGGGGGAGGGGGGYASGTLITVPLTLVPVTIGGAGKGATVLDGSDGQGTTVTSGINSISGGGGAGGQASGIGGAGGAGSFNGIVTNFTSNTGGAGGVGDNQEGGAGGGGAGSTENGGDGEDAMGPGTPAGGTGGNSGGGNGGDGGNDGDGVSGSDWGGGGGATGQDGGTPGDGANGAAIISYKCATLSLLTSVETTNQTVMNGAFVDIQYAIGLPATGAIVNGLPMGVMGNFNAGILTISGTPTETGVFNYTVITIGSGCDSLSLTGTINVLSILPISLINFSAELMPRNEVHLQWATANEINNDYMTVEHSSDGALFNEVGRVPGQGTSFEPQSYELWHTNPALGTNYYRLSQTDLDGTVSYHGIESIQVKGDNTLPSWNVSPNPTHEKFRVTWDQPFEAGGMIIRLLDTRGQVLAVQTIQAGDSFIEFQVASYPAGMYYLQLDEGSSLQTISFIKN